jgi:hypothetical protein
MTDSPNPVEPDDVVAVDGHPLTAAGRDPRDPMNPWPQVREIEDHGDHPYCDYCETVGHTFRSCPRRDDDPGYG